jgi:hypothetical protein
MVSQQRIPPAQKLFHFRLIDPVMLFIVEHWNQQVQVTKQHFESHGRSQLLQYHTE